MVYAQAIDQPKSYIDKNWVKGQNGTKWNGALLKRLLLKWKPSKIRLPKN